MSDLSVVLVGGEPGRAVRAVAAAWTAAGLLTESLWVVSDDIALEGSGLARVPAQLLAPDGTRAGDLFELVGLRHVDLLRLVAVQQVTHAYRPPAAFPAHARLLGDLLQAAVPLSADGVSGTRVHRVNLIIGESRATGLALGHLQPVWDVNGIVAAEDRPDLDRSSVFVRDPGNSRGHSAAAIASVGGLWSGVPRGALDTVQADSTTSEGDLFVLRSSARAVLGTDAAEAVAREAMTMATGGAAGPAQLLGWARPATDPLAVVRRASRFLLDQGDWRPGSPAPPPEPRQVVRGFRAALVDAVRFNGSLFRVGGALALRTGRRLFEDAATGILVGRESDTLVRTGPRTADSMFEVAQERVQAQESELDAAARVSEAAGVPAPRPQTWQQLRRVCFALVDGGGLPAGLAAPEHGGLRELVPPWAIAPAPGPTPAAPGAAPPHTPGRGATSPSAPAPHEPGGAARASWDGALVRQLDDELTRRATALDEELARLDASVPAEPPGRAALQRAERRLKVRWVVAVIWFVVAAVVTASYFSGQPTARGASWALSLTVLVPLSVIIGAHHFYYRTLRRYEWVTEQALVDRRRRAEARIFARRERARLRLLHDALVDWAEIIGHLVHRPWSPGTATSLELADDVVQAFPAAVGVGVARGAGERGASPAALAAVAVLCHRGWSSELFDDLVASLDEESTDNGHSAADLDSRDSPLSPRRQLLQACRTGASSTLAAQRATARIREAVAEGRLRLPDRLIERVGRFADGRPVRETEFYRATLGPATPFALDQWTPAGLHRARHVPRTSSAWVPRVDGELPGGVEVTETAGTVALRVDISRRAEPGDLLLFASDDGPGPASTRATSEPDLVEW